MPPGGEIFFGVVGLIAVLIASVVAYVGQARVERLMTHGERIPGQVYDVRRHIQHHNPDDFSFRQDKYFIKVRFTHPSGPYHEEEIRVGRDVAHHFRRAGWATPIEVAVIVDPADISNWQIAGLLGAPFRGIFLIYGVLGLAALALIGHGVQRHRQAKGAREENGDHEEG
jgi:hypothetical protein